MTERVSVLLAFLFAGVVLFVGSLVAQNRLYYFNGVPYVFPSSQGAAGEVLTNDGAGTLTWDPAVSPEGLWSGAVIVSTSTCPAGFTRFSSADNRVLRGDSVAGNPAGSDTHTHSLTGTSAGSAVSVTGTTASTAPSVTGTSGSTDIAHTHSATPSTNTLGAGATSFVTSVSVQSGGGSHTHTAGSLAGSSHSHGDGSLAGSSHTHAAGSLAAASSSNLPAYHEVILCQKD